VVLGAGVVAGRSGDHGEEGVGDGIHVRTTPAPYAVDARR
jgi:hypothetical protein